MDIKKRLLLLLLCFISIVPSIAQRDHIDISNYILCINSYAESSPWSNRMISTVTEYVQKDPQLALYAEHMNMLMIENDSTLAEFKLSISQKYKRHRPRLLILLGNPALLMRDEYRELWGDIPIVLCSEENYLGPQETYTKKQAIATADRTPLTQLADPYNMVLLYSNLYLDENIQLICHIVPEIKKNGFAKKLYSTYLSYLPENKVGFPLKMNVDSRGSFTELIKTAKCGQVSVNISKPGITKGEHWHNTKWEVFIVVSGKGLIEQRKIGTDEVLKFYVSGDKIEAVHMLPGYTHNIINLSDSENLVTVMYANELFDPKHPDTFFEKVEK